MARTTKKPALSKEVATIKGGPAALYDYGEVAGVGAKDITSEDFLLPFVRVAQTNSPQLNKKDDRYLAGLAAGQYFNISTGRIYGGAEDDEDPFIAHVCAKLRAFAEFIPRDSGGGFVGQREADDELVMQLRARQGKFGKLVNENEGTEITETYYLYSLVPPDDEYPDPEAIVLAFSSTGITPVKQFLMRVNPLIRRGVPIYAPRVQISSRTRTNSEGTFFVPDLAFAGADPLQYLLRPNDPLMPVCQELRESVTTGRAKVDFAQAHETGDEEDEPEVQRPAPKRGRGKGSVEFTQPTEASRGRRVKGNAPAF